MVTKYALFPLLRSDCLSASHRACTAASEETTQSRHVELSCSILKLADSNSPGRASCLRGLRGVHHEHPRAIHTSVSIGSHRCKWHWSVHLDRTMRLIDGAGAGNAEKAVRVRKIAFTDNEAQQSRPQVYVSAPSSPRSAQPAPDNVVVPVSTDSKADDRIESKRSDSGVTFAPWSKATIAVLCLLSVPLSDLRLRSWSDAQ